MFNRKITAAIGASALILAGGIATTAAAQPWASYDHYESRLTTSYVDSLEWRIHNSPMSYGERRALLNELRQIQPLAWRVETGQASRWEYNRLVAGVNRIERATQYAGYERYPRYGYNRWR